jgi:hypothetical protein
VDDWVNAKGEFSDFGENLLISRRFHARPVLIAETHEKETDPQRKQDQGVEFLVSVVDGPEPMQKEPANREYKTSVRYELEVTGKEEMEVTAYVQVIGVQTGEKIPPYVPAGLDNFKATDKKELAVKLGKIRRTESLPESVDVKVAYRLKDRNAQPPVVVPATPVPSTPGGKTPKPAITTDGAGNFFERWNVKKATPRPDPWGGYMAAKMGRRRAGQGHGLSVADVRPLEGCAAEGDVLL